MRQEYGMTENYDGRTGADVYLFREEQNVSSRQLFSPGRTTVDHLAEKYLPVHLDERIVLYAADKKGTPKKDGDGGGSGNTGRGCDKADGGRKGRGGGRGGGQGGGKGRN